jgi:hypothetical protein
VLAVALALGLLIIGGVALWGALTNRDSGKPVAATPLPSGAVSSKASDKQPTQQPPGNQGGNTIVIHCLAVQCPVFVAGPGPTDVQFHGNLTQNERRIFTETRLTVAVDDASTVSVTINGRQQARGRRGESKTYDAPAQQ